MCFPSLILSWLFMYFPITSWIIPAQVKQDDVLPHCFSSSTVNKQPFYSPFIVIFCICVYLVDFSVLKNSIDFFCCCYFYWFLLLESLCAWSFFKMIVFILFLDRGEGSEKGRERNINVWMPLACPLLGTWPATLAWERFGWQVHAQSTEPHQPWPLGHFWLCIAHCIYFFW